MAITFSKTYSLLMIAIQNSSYSKHSSEEDVFSFVLCFCAPTLMDIVKNINKTIRFWLL